MLKFMMALFASMLFASNAVSMETSPPDEVTPFHCLRMAAQQGSGFAECRGLVFNHCINQIIDAGGNPGTSAGVSCRVSELSSWLEAWAFLQSEATWHVQEGDSIESVLGRFSEAQITANAQCVPKSETAGLPMATLADCMSDFYSDFLINEIQTR